MAPLADNARCYTLLADESCVFSKEEKHYKAFKAHIVYNLILNGGIIFSDNQIISSINLRRLSHRDGTVRQLFKDGLLQLTMRTDEQGPDGISSLAMVHDAFVKEGKVSPGSYTYDFTPELAFLEKNALKQGWSYDKVRDSYTETAERVLLETFKDRLKEGDFAHFAKLIADERERDKGLGRHFLQRRLANGMHAAGIEVTQDTIDTILRCTDAPYVSNLPRVMGLDPIYAPEHRASFELLRGGGNIQFRNAGEARNVPAKLTEQLFVEGLCALDMDDIIALTQCGERTHFIRCQADFELGKAEFGELENAFIALNVRVQDRIVSRFPEIARQCPSDQAWVLREQYATRTEYGLIMLLDLALFTWSPLHGLPMLGTALKCVFDLVKKGTVDRASERRPSDIIAGHFQQTRHLERILEASNSDERLRFDRMVGTDSFERETLVS